MPAPPLASAPPDVSLEARVATALREVVDGPVRCLVAVSGGGDSLALLDLLHRSTHRHECALIVGHVDHGMARGSGAIADRVAAAASERGLACVSHTLALAPSTSETRARIARRGALRELAARAGAQIIALAHHADDQAETVLLRVLRGSGPAGLAAMAPRRGIWVRPLLAVRRVELEAHLDRRGIVPWRDPANADPRHLRSWLRVAVMPALAARLPELVERLNNTARQAAAARNAWAQVVDHLPDLDLRRECGAISVAAAAIQGYRSALRHAVLASLGRECETLLGTRRLAAIDRLLADDRPGSIAVSREVRAELAFGRLTFHQQSLSDVPGESGAVLRPGDAITVDAVRLTAASGVARRCERRGWQTWLVPGEYIVRGARPGDRIRPLGGAGSRAVMVLLREARIPPRRRGSWPVVVDSKDATIVWVPGICRADTGVPAEGAVGWHVDGAVA